MVTTINLFNWKEFKKVASSRFQDLPVVLINFSIEENLLVFQCFSPERNLLLQFATDVNAFIEPEFSEKLKEEYQKPVKEFIKSRNELLQNVLKEKLERAKKELEDLGFDVYEGYYGVWKE